MDKKVFLCGLHQESNSFNPLLSEYEDFGHLKGDELINRGRAAGVIVFGMIEVLKSYGITPVCGSVLRAGSGGPLNSKVYEFFINDTIAEIRKAGKIDGVVVDLHGATVSDKSDDVCGDILEAIRNEVGEDAIISASCDLHGNITEKMVKNADYVSGYQSYPHIDLGETGSRAAKVLCERLDGRNLKMARVALPIMAPAHGYTTASGNLKVLMDKAFKLKEDGTIFDFSIFQVQPWLDCKKVASTVLVIADNEEKAKQVATDLAKDEFRLKEELQGEKLFTIDEVIQKALKNESDKPIVLVDSADSSNAGASGDSAAVIEALLPYKDVLKAAADVKDAAAVERAFELGVGAVADFTLGATIAPKLSKPVLVKGAKVRSLHDGTFERFGPQEKGIFMNIGKVAVLEVGKLLIHVSAKATANGDMNFYRGFGIDPLAQQLVNIKACTSFRAGYQPVSAEICNTSTPGAAGTVLEDLPFEKLPEPMYPFSDITEEMISEAKCFR
ncbi:MAG: M81 family metallopeptidase [Clostridia bacterium]|nr:M81 family metallopeptidase [Clostridia bacterium]MBR2973635.1 M81 family metallopeptidase [Clostridia bacterium]